MHISITNTATHRNLQLKVVPSASLQAFFSRLPLQMDISISLTVSQFLHLTLELYPFPPSESVPDFLRLHKMMS